MAKKSEGSHLIPNLLIGVCLIGIIILAVMIMKMHKSIKTLQLTEASQATNQQINSVSYKCDGDKTIQAVYFNNTVELSLSDGRSLLLMQGISASGIRYTNSDESIIFWSKGNTAFMEEGPNETVTYNNCTETKN